MNPFNRRSVTGGVDFDRILRLPTRGPLDLEQLAREMTDALRAPGGTQTLRGVQAQALFELMTRGGLLAPMGVGTGKTLVFLLASVVLGLRRAIGLLPASLIEKTERERRELLKHWRLDRGLQLFSYEMLGRESSAKWLEQKAPDGVITDESHRLKNLKAASTRRVKRWMHDHPTTRFVAMSGTLTKNSVRDFAHLARWALTPAGAPVPQQEGELSEWADALDERVQPLKRVRPGVLVRLAKPGDIVEGDDTATARRAFHRRLVETPGIVCSLNAEQVDCSLSVEGKILSVNAETDKNFEKLRTMWETPDGWALSEAVDVWRHARELALGMHYVWDPRPPDKWLEARRGWAKFVRDVLSRSRTLDSEKQVRSAVLSDELPEGREIWNAWDEIRPTFQVNQKAVWHDTSALDHCKEWMNDNVGIVWTEHTFFGHELSRRTGWPYFGQNGLDAKGRSILDAEGPIIASIAANGTGKNLQRYRHNLITACPTGAAVWEQLLGRTHRPGQLADEVTAEVLVGCIEHVDAWTRAIAESEMARDMFGQPQKILYADVNMPKAAEVRMGHASGAHRWRKTTGEKNRDDG